MRWCCTLAAPGQAARGDERGVLGGVREDPARPVRRQAHPPQPVPQPGRRLRSALLVQGTVCPAACPLLPLPPPLTDRAAATPCPGVPPVGGAARAAGEAAARRPQANSAPAALHRARRPVLQLPWAAAEGHWLHRGRSAAGSPCSRINCVFTMHAVSSRGLLPEIPLKS